MATPETATHILEEYFLKNADLFSRNIDLNILRSAWPNEILNPFGPQLTRVVALMQRFRINAEFTPNEAEIAETLNFRQVVTAEINNTRTEAEIEATKPSPDDGALLVYEISLTDLENLSRLIEAVIAKFKMEAATQKALVQREARRGIDRAAVWDSFVKWQALATETEPTATLEVHERVERRNLNYAMGVLTTNFWGTWNDEKKGTDVLALPVGSEESGKQNIPMSELIDNHPPGPESGDGSETQMRERLKVITKAFQGGIHFNEMAKTDHTHETMIEHMKKFLFNGEEWEYLAHLPPLKDGERGLGDSSLEALSIFANWNDRYIKCNDSDFAEVTSAVEDEIARGVHRIPSESELSRAIAMYDADDEKSLDGIEFKGPRPDFLTPKLILFLYVVAAERNYAEFRDYFSITIQKQRVVSIESKRQKQFGLFPLRQYGEQPRFDSSGTQIVNIEHFMPHIAISVGCFQLNLGEYKIEKQRDARGNEFLSVSFTDASGVRRNLTPEETQAAFTRGKAATLLGFHTYQAHTGPVGDDNVERKSNLQAVKIDDTGHYRANYAANGREGRFNVDFVERLNIHPLDYLAADGQSIRKLSADRGNRLHANYKLMSDKMKDQAAESYSFAETMYKAYKGGLDDAVSGFDIESLVSLETNAQLVSTVQYINVKDNALTGLKNFVTQKIGYLVDRYMFSGTPASIVHGPYDAEVWEQVMPGKAAGEFIYSPLLQMLNLSERERAQLLEDAKAVGFKSAVVKAFLTPMVIETFMRINTREVKPFWVQGVRYIFSGKQPEPRYSIRNRDDLTVALSAPDDDIVFRYKPDEFNYMIAISSKEVKGPIEVFLKRQGGL